MGSGCRGFLEDHRKKTKTEVPGTGAGHVCQNTRRRRPEINGRCVDLSDPRCSFMHLSAMCGRCPKPLLARALPTVRASVVTAGSGGRSSGLLPERLGLEVGSCWLKGEGGFVGAGDFCLHVLSQFCSGEKHRNVLAGGSVSPGSFIFLLCSAVNEVLTY